MYGPGVQPGVSYTYPNVQSFGGSQPVYQLPGHSVVITNGPNGHMSEYCPNFLPIGVLLLRETELDDLKMTLSVFAVQQVPVVPTSPSAQPTAMG